MQKAVEEQAKNSIEEAKVQLEEIENIKAFHILEGDPALKITQLAEEKNIDLIVLGSRGLGKVREFLLGSVSYNVVQLAKCPVFIIK